MTCRDAREWLTALIDDALDAGERAELDAHLADCADCRRELERLGKTVSLLRAVEPVRAPAGFVDRVIAAAHPEPWHRRVRGRLLVPARASLAAAAALLVATLAAYVFQRAPELQQAARREAPPAPARQYQETPGAAREPSARAGAPDGEQPPARPAPPLPPAPPAGLAAPEDTATGDAGSALLRGKSRSAEPAVVTASPDGKEPERLVPSSGASPSSPARPVPIPESSREAPAERPASPPASRNEQAQEGRVALSAPRAIPPSSPQALRAAGVAGRLIVGDRQAADRELAAILTRVGGVESARHTEDGALVLRVLVPGPTYKELASALARIGSWQPDAELTDPPPHVMVTIRITQ